MKWDKKNKRKVHYLLRDKWRSCRTILLKPPFWRSYVTGEEWKTFLDSLKIVEVHRDDSRSKWMREGDTPNEYDIPAASKKHIIVKDPALPNNGLSIPKEVAEKFLVLGVP